MFISDIPYNYAMCMKKDCPQAAICLRSIAWSMVSTDEPFVRIVNPSLASSNTDCPFYRDSSPVRFAKGFVKMKDEMTTKQYSEFMYRLIGKFGRNPYFVRRRGERLLPPSEQEIVLKVLKDIGIEKELKFDSYEECIDW